MAVIRKSNIELLRIIAMFMVMILHVNNTTLGVPSVDDTHADGFNVFFRIFFEVFAIGSVNVFVLISGWFGINPSFKSLSSFIFQCVFITWLGSLFSFITGLSYVSFASIDATIFVRSWFVQCYLLLYILSPALNSIVEKSRIVHKYIIIGLLFMELFYDFISKDTMIFRCGYSTLHFIILYLIARYIRKNKTLRFLNDYAFPIFLITITGVSVIEFYGLFYGIPNVLRLSIYSSPFIIITALCLLFCFNKMNITSLLINKIASSSFAVYLLHTNPLILTTLFVPLALKIYNSYNGCMLLLMLSLYMTLWYIVAIIVDIIRIKTWAIIMPKITKLYGKNKLD